MFFFQLPGEGCLGGLGGAFLDPVAVHGDRRAVVAFLETKRRADGHLVLEMLRLHVLEQFLQNRLRALHKAVGAGANGDLHFLRGGAIAEFDPLPGDAPAVVLETAHPAKFPDEIERLLGFSPVVPAALAALDQLPEDFDRLPVGYEQFRQYLLTRYTR